MARRMKRVLIPREDLFDSESPPAIVLQSEAISEAEIDKEVAAIDKLLEGDDEAFDKLEY